MTETSTSCGSSAVLRTLPNGLRVVLAPCEAESIAFGLFVASGSRHEPARLGGISHFIEHMLFKGTPTRRPVDITRAIEGRGGNFNACTGEESTCYYAHLPNEYLGEAVDILVDMYLRATIPDTEFEREKAVVLEEIKMYGDEPDSVAMENLQRALFPGHPLGRPVAGSAKTLGPLHPEDLRRYIAAHYRADNTVAVLVGDFDEEDAMRSLGAAFAPLAAVRRRAGVRTAAPTADVEHAADRTKKDIQQTQVALGYRMFGVTDRRTYAAAVMDAVLGRGMSSRLFQEVREKRGLSYDISSRIQHFTDSGMLTITAGIDPTREGQLLKTVERELGRIRDVRLGAAELRRTKEFLLGNFRLSLEKVTTRLFFYGTTTLAFGRLVLPREQVSGVAAVTADDVRSVARDIFTPANRALSRVVPCA